MTVPLTDSLDDVAQAVIDKLVANVSLLVSSDLEASIPEAQASSNCSMIFYGDQEKFPATPAICVEPVSRMRDLQGVSYRTDNNFTVYVMVFVAKVQDNQVTRKQAQTLSEVIEGLLHVDAQLGGLLINSFCSNNESGYVFRNNTMYRTNRITYTGYSKTRLR